MLEWLLIGVASALGVRALRLRERYVAPLLAAMATTSIVLGLATSYLRAPRSLPPIARSSSEAFVTSQACRSCHPNEYASWHASFHRSMTQIATLDAVASPALRQGGRLRVETDGRSVELFARQGQLWAQLPDPGVTSAAPSGDYQAAFRVAPARNVRVELLTGSHRQQAFWVRGARSGELRAVPAVYVIAEQRLIPRRDAFLNPPDAAERSVRWNSNCVQCHAVAGEPGYDDARDTFATSAAELGIACEACHGPGAAHVRAMQSPLARYRARAEDHPSLGLVSPARLSSERASQVCGRCHSYFFPTHEAEWWQHGFTRSYSPGDDLAQAQLLLSPELLRTPGAPQLGAAAESLFYGDGSIRVGGREYSGLVRSPCYERGRGDEQLSCLSCHSLHRGAPDAQLDPQRLGNRACARCHERESRTLQAHTHHAASSPGSLCYNCHMPETSYALLRSIRSHRITSPAFDAESRDRPNACSLCHLGRSEAWAAARAREFWGQRPAFELEPAPQGTDATLPAGALLALSGNAAVRAVTAAALGRHQSDGDDAALRAQLLAELARDDYAAVRTIARRSQTTLRPSSAPPPLSHATLERLLAARDRRPLTIAE